MRGGTTAGSAHWSPETIDRAKSLWCEKGLPAWTIAEVLGAPLRDFLNLVAANPDLFPPPQAEARGLNPDQISLARRLWQANNEDEAIARALGVGLKRFQLAFDAVRQQHPDWFAKREVVDDGESHRKADAAELHRQLASGGRPTVELVASALGRTPSEIEDAVAQYEEGATRHQVSGATRIGPQNLRIIEKSFGITPARASTKPMLELIRQSREEGETVPLDTVAKAAGVDIDTAESIAQDLRDGMHLQDAVVKHSLPYARLRLISEAIGWQPSWRPVGYLTDGKCGTMLISEMLRLFDDGLSLTLIGAKAGVSRERVRQIAKAHGRKPRLAGIREAMEARDQLRLARRAARAEAKRATWERRLAKRRDFLKVGNEMWAAGSSLSAVAAAYNIPANSFAWYMNFARRHLGPEWFPLRGRGTRASRDAVERAAARRLRMERQFAQANALWLAGRTGPEIAAAIGVELKDFQWQMWRCRKALGGEWFPPRRGPTSDAAAQRASSLRETMAEANSLWCSGATIAAITAQCGFSSDSCFYSRVIACRRLLGAEWFPLRSHRNPPAGAASPEPAARSLARGPSRDELSLDEACAATGAAPSQVLAWARDHGWPKPIRTSRGVRYYSTEQIESLRRIVSLNDTGTRIADLIVDGLPVVQ